MSKQLKILALTAVARRLGSPPHGYDAPVRSAQEELRTDTMPTPFTG